MYGEASQVANDAVWKHSNRFLLFCLYNEPLQWKMLCPLDGDGIMLFFHGKKDRDFCLVSETNLHINGHFIGKSKKEGLKRDFTWVQSIGMQFDFHKLYLGANKVATWDDAHDEHSVFLDDQPIVLPPARGAELESVVGHNSPEY